MNYKNALNSILIFFMLFAHLVFLCAPKTQAAALKVEITPASYNIPGSGATQLTITVKDASGNLINGAGIALSDNCGGSFAPPSGVTGPVQLGTFITVFTGPATPATQPVIICVITAQAQNPPLPATPTDAGSDQKTIIVGQGYAPLVSIPGIGTPTSFTAHIIALYRLALGVIGIFALMMIVYGGFRYMTSAGNPTAMGDARDAIFNAILGLILALFSWLILSTINPELTVVKTPGTTPVLYSTSSSTSAVKCAEDDNLILANCKCIDGTTQPNPAPQKTCNTVCATNNCFKADFRIGFMTIDDFSTLNTYPSDYARAKAYAVYDTKYEKPLEANVKNITMCDMILAINAVDYTITPPGVPPPTYSLDVNLVGTIGTPPCINPPFDDIITNAYPAPLAGGYFGFMACNIPPYECLNDESECKFEAWSNSILCPIRIKVDWGGGNVKYATQFIKWYAP